jgi:hypothetical protein
MQRGVGGGGLYTGSSSLNGGLTETLDRMTLKILGGGCVRLVHIPANSVGPGPCTGLAVLGIAREPGVRTVLVALVEFENG